MATEILPSRLSLASQPFYLTGDLLSNGLYAVGTSKLYHYGQRFITWNGSIFKYAYATTGGVYAYHGARSTLAAVLTITAAAFGHAVGSTKLTVTLTGRSKDDLLGGMIAIYDGAAIDNTCVRNIVGNEASGATYTDVYIDYPIDWAITTADSDKFEIWGNEYASTTESNDSYSAWLGVPAKTAAATYNYWLQTWGRCLISGGETIDSPAADSRTLVWGSNAVLYKIATKVSGQVAGYILNQGSSSVAGPILYLMCST